MWYVLESVLECRLWVDGVESGRKEGGGGGVVRLPAPPRAKGICGGWVGVGSWRVMGWEVVVMVVEGMVENVVGVVEVGWL